MSKRVHFVMPEQLIARIDALADVIGISRGEFVRRACDAALEIEYRAPDVIQPYAPSERVGIANAVVAPEPPSLTAVEDPPMCRVCERNGPPKTRPCAKCGHQR